MKHQRAQAVGDLMLLLHLRVRGEETPLLQAAIVRFAEVFRSDGAAKDSTVGVLRGLIDQAVASADLTSPAILDIVDELHSAPIALCISVYDRVHA